MHFFYKQKEKLDSNPNLIDVATLIVGCSSEGHPAQQSEAIAPQIICLIPDCENIMTVSTNM